MKNKKLKNFIGDALELLDNNSPTFLAGLALCGIVATAYFSYRAGSKSVEVLEKKEKDMADVDPDDEEAKKAVKREAIKELLPIVAPPVIMGAVTGACVLGGAKISNKRIALLSAAYNMAESRAKDLNGKMEEMLGEKKVRSIKDAIVKDKLTQNEPINEQNIIITGDGDVLCMDLYSGRPFYSNAQKIQAAINRLSADCQTEMYVSLNDLYMLLNMKPSPIGDDFGWNADDLVRGQLPITISAQLTEDQKPCLCLEYDAELRDNFRNLH